MALTKNCDLFCAIHEDGINQLIRHIRRKRPALFNYGTQAVADNPELLCQPINFAPEVVAKGNPLITVEDPLPVFGTNTSTPPGKIGLNFCAQLAELEVDLHPETFVQLPPELSPPLKEQCFAIHARVCAGIGCPSDEVLASLIPEPTFSPSAKWGKPPPSDKPMGKVLVSYAGGPVPTHKLECFCIDLFAVAHFEIVGDPKVAQGLVTRLDGVEIVDIQPNELEANLECYIKLLIKVVILPRLAFALDTLVLEIPNLAAIAVSATPTSAAVPNNPAIEKDQLKVFISINVTS
jgi:hypothetical protein